MRLFILILFLSGCGSTPEPVPEPPGLEAAPKPKRFTCESLPYRPGRTDFRCRNVDKAGVGYGPVLYFCHESRIPVVRPVDSEPHVCAD